MKFAQSWYSKWTHYHSRTYGQICYIPGGFLTVSIILIFVCLHFNFCVSLYQARIIIKIDNRKNKKEILVKKKKKGNSFWPRQSKVVLVHRFPQACPIFSIFTILHGLCMSIGWIFCRVWYILEKICQEGSGNFQFALYMLSFAILYSYEQLEDMKVVLKKDTSSC